MSSLSPLGKADFYDTLPGGPCNGGAVLFCRQQCVKEGMGGVMLQVWGVVCVFGGRWCGYGLPGSNWSHCYECGSRGGGVGVR